MSTVQYRSAVRFGRDFVDQLIAVHHVYAFLLLLECELCDGTTNPKHMTKWTYKPRSYKVLKQVNPTVTVACPTRMISTKVTSITDS